MTNLTNAGKILQASKGGFKIKNRLGGYATLRSLTITDASTLLGIDRKEAKKVLDTMVSDGVLTKEKDTEPFAPFWYRLTEKGEMIRDLA